MTAPTAGTTVAIFDDSTANKDQSDHSLYGFRWIVETDLDGMIVYVNLQSTQDLSCLLAT